MIVENRYLANVLIILFILLSACTTNQNTETKTYVRYVISEEHKELYLQELKLLHFEISSDTKLTKEEILNDVIFPINLTYLKMAKSINFFSSNLNFSKEYLSKHNNNVVGVTRQTENDNFIIYIFVDENSTTSSLMATLLHEIKHIWCKVEYPEEEKECQNQFLKNNDRTEFNKCTHQSCFLDTPIDKEYGFIE